MGAKMSKCYSYQSQPKVFKLFLNFLPNGPHKMMFGIFEIFSFQILMIFFSKISNSPLHDCSLIWRIKNPNYLETIDCGAKLSEIWDSWVVIQHI